MRRSRRGRRGNGRSHLAAADLPRLAEWLAEPQVARWWHHDASMAGVERDFGPSVRGEEPAEDLVVLLDGQPIGLLQRSRVHDYPEDLAELATLVEVPPGAVEIDYLIGQPALRGHGLGTRLIAEAVQDTWNAYPDAAAVLVAVVAATTASWRAVERAGLTRVAEGPMTPDNPIDDPRHYIYRTDRPQHVGRGPTRVPKVRRGVRSRITARGAHRLSVFDAMLESTGAICAWHALRRNHAKAHVGTDGGGRTSPACHRRHPFRRSVSHVPLRPQRGATRRRGRDETLR